MMIDPAVRTDNLIKTISEHDGMFVANEERHYFSVGQSALECIEVSLRAARKPFAEVKKILDLPCGYGRVMRYLRAAFPEAEITACDLLREGVDFCAATFNAIPVYSDEDPAKIPLAPRTFDLIWVGSLLTHLDRAQWSRFLKIFCGLLRPGGVLVFSTHGREVYRNMTVENLDYAMPHERRAALLHLYERSGFGYADYAGHVGYGISLSAGDWVIKQLAGISGIRLVHFSEKAWDNHQDVFACVADPAWDIPSISSSSMTLLQRGLMRAMPGRYNSISEQLYRAERFLSHVKSIRGRRTIARLKRLGRKSSP